MAFTASSSLVAAVLSAISFAAGAQAPPASDTSACRSIPASEPDRAIARCTANIESGRLTGDALAEAYALRATRWRQKADLPRALADLDAAISAAPEHAMAYYMRGEIHFAGAAYESAIADFSAAISIFFPADEGTPDAAHIELLRQSDGDLASAVALMFKARGSAYFVVQDWDRAITDLDVSLEIDSHHFDAYAVRGRAWYEKQEYQRALADLDKAIDLEPRLGLSRYFRGVVLERAGETGRAIDDFEHALQLDPASGWGRAELAWLLATAPAHTLRDGERALALAHQACDGSANAEPRCLELLAASHAQAGQYTDAIRWEERAIADLESRHAPSAESRRRLALYQSGQSFSAAP